MKIHHVGYLTRDLEACLRQLTALGFSLERAPAPDPGRGVRIAFVRNGAYRVEVICPDGPDSPMYPLLKRYKNTPYHLCYETEDLEAKAAELVRAGYTPMGEAAAAPCIDGRSVQFLLHGELGIIELVETPPGAAWS